MKTPSENFENEFLGDPDYAEDIIYYSKDSSPAKEIPAVIFRNKFKQKAQYGNRGTQSQAFTYDIEIGISRGTLGILSVFPGLDFVELPTNEGETVLERFNVSAIIEQDRGFFKLGLRK
jgi:hypothetical protein